MQPRNRQNPKSSFGSWALSAVAIASAATPIVIVAPARAAVLNDWSFDPASQAITITLPDNVTPQFFLLAEPARIVLEIPNTTLGSAPPAEQYSGVVRSIRLSEVAGGSRVVVELAPNTRLDPRHADLTATELGNGQTQWTLLPLLQDVPVAPVAAAPPEPASAPTPVPPTSTTAPTPPAVESPSTNEEPLPETTAESTAPVAPEALSGAEADSEIAADTEAPEPPENEPDAIASETDEESSVPITVTPNPDLPEPSSLPDIATSATTGAAQSLPTGPDPLEGVSTDAATLEGVASDSLSDLPPEQMPLDPFAAASPQSTVSVPSLAETDSTPAPAVSVPPVANVPGTPTAPQRANAASTGTPANQVRPPGNRGVAAGSPARATAPPAAAVTAPPVATTPPSPEPEAIAANSAERPPLPPTPAESDDPNQVRPPTAPNATSSSATITEPPPVVDPAAATVAPPPTPATASENAPPFLPPPASSTNQSPPPPTERPSIPPPPSVPNDDGTLPFGAPLPQTKSLGDVNSSSASAGRSVLPVGTRLSLQYVGATPLVLSEQEPVYEVLVLTGNVYDPATGALLLPSGAQVLGRFEGIDDNGRRFVAQSITYGRDRLPLLVESDWLVGVTQPSGVDVALGSSIGAAAVTILAGFSGIGLIGGAAIGAVAGFAESPTLVTIEPGTTIQVEVVSEVLPFNDAPAVSQQYR